MGCLFEELEPAAGLEAGRTTPEFGGRDLGVPAGAVEEHSRPEEEELPATFALDVVWLAAKKSLYRPFRKGKARIPCKGRGGC